MKSWMIAATVVHAFLLIVSLPTAQCKVRAMDKNDLVESTCKQTPNYDLCISSLRSDPKSSTADVRGLALIMVNVIKAKATETLNHINDLLKGGPGGGKDKQALSSCADGYSAILKADVPEATQALTLGNVKFAENGVSDAAVEANACERGFSSSGRTSPLTDVNKNMNEICNVARAIVRMLL